MAADPPDTLTANLLRDDIQDYVAQHPDPRWSDLKALLLDKGEFLPVFIEKYGVDILIQELKNPRGRSTRSAQRSAGRSPPASTDIDASRQTLDQDNAGSSDAEGQDSDPGPRMADDHTWHQICAVFCDPSTGQKTDSDMSANYCENRTNFIHSKTVRDRCLDKFVDQRTNTLLLEWRAEPESERFLGGNGRIHRTRFKVVNSDAMDCDLALSQDMESWDNWETMVSPICDVTRETPQLEPQPQVDQGPTKVSLMKLPARFLTEEQPPRDPTYFLVPFPRNKEFVGREVLLRNLKSTLMLDDGPRLTAIVGLGGIGKTQLALETAYHAKIELEWSVFWIPAPSALGIGQAWEEMAKMLSLQAHSQDHAKLAVQHYLESTRSGRWLLIIDNADDEYIVEGVLSHLPRHNRGRILFTTRSKNLALTVAADDIVKVDEMSDAEGLDLLHKLLPESHLADSDGIVQLLSNVAFLPLAISQAAGYLKSSGCSVSEYIALSRYTYETAPSLISDDFPGSARDAQSAHSVATTFLVSLRRIEVTDPTAARLLSFLSQIEPDAIPESMLPRTGTDGQVLDAIRTLESFALLQRREDTKMLQMHRLAQGLAWNWIASGPDPLKARRASIRHLSTIFHSDNWGDRARWRQYLPHILKILRNNGENTNRDDEEYELAYWAGRCLYVEGRILEALKLLQHVVEMRCRMLTEDHPSRLASMRELGRVYLANGQIEEAITLLENVVGIQRIKLTKNHPDRLASEHELSRAYQANGRVEDAIKLLERTLGVEGMAEDHPDRLESQHALAEAYQASGRVEKAVELLEHVVKIRKAALPKDHPNLLASQYTLALAYRSHNQSREAVELLESVLNIRKQVFIGDHPLISATEYTLESAKLALVLEEQETRSNIFNAAYAQSLDEPVFSDDSASASTAPSSVAEVDNIVLAQELMVKLIVRDHELKSLLLAALLDPKIGGVRLRRNLPQALQKFAKSLHDGSNTRQEQVTSWFVKSNASSLATLVCEAALGWVPTTGPQYQISTGKSAWASLEQEENDIPKKAHLNRFLESLTQAESQQTASTQHEIPTAVDQTSLNLEFEFLQQPTSFLDSMEAFVKSSLEYLRAPLRNFIMPISVQNLDIGPAIGACTEGTSQKWEYLYPYPYTLAEHVDKFLEILGFPWFTLPAPTGLTRVNWHCACGRCLHADYPSDNISVQRASNSYTSHEVIGTRQTPHVVRGQITSAMNSVSVFLGSAVAGVERALGKTRPRNDTEQELPTIEPRTTTTKESQPQQESETRNLTLLLCIDRGHFNTQLHQVKLPEIKDDKTLFQFLRTTYYTERGLSRLSLRSVSSLSLTRFHVDNNNHANVHPHKDHCTSSGGCVCLPAKHRVDKEYLCAPAPVQDDGMYPAIPPETLSHYFTDPCCLNRPQTSNLKQIPKLKDKLHTCPDSRTVGWGIHFKEDWHWRTLVVFGTVLVICSLIFGVAWSARTGDVSSAFAVTAAGFTLVSVVSGALALVMHP